MFYVLRAWLCNQWEQSLFSTIWRCHAPFGLTRVPLGDQTDWGSKQHSLSCCAGSPWSLSQKVPVHKGPLSSQPSLRCLELERARSTSAFLVSQIIEFVSRGFSHSHEKLYNTNRTACAVKAFAFLDCLGDGLSGSCGAYTFFTLLWNTSCILG